MSKPDEAPRKYVVVVLGGDAVKLLYPIAPGHCPTVPAVVAALLASAEPPVITIFIGEEEPA